MSRIDGSTLAALEALGVASDGERAELDQALAVSEKLRLELQDF